MSKSTKLSKPPYLLEVTNFLKKEEPESWDWLSEAENQRNISDSLRLDLLKTTYRLDRHEHHELYQSAEDIKSLFNLEIPLTLYQAQGEHSSSAALYYLPGEAHVVFFGKILDLLNQNELKVIIAHELSHYSLWQDQGGDFFIADQLLNAMANDPRAENAHLQTCRRFQLFTEIFADRGALNVLNDAESVVQTLVKVTTELKTASGASYIKQAEEIFSKNKLSSEGSTHPEVFIRARALKLTEDQSDQFELEIEQMINGEIKLDELDLINQNQLATDTQHLISKILQPTWLKQNELFAQHAKMYENEDVTQSYPPSVDLSKYTHNSIQQYFIFLMLDFIALDAEIQDAVALHCHELAKEMKLAALFTDTLIKELKFTKTHWKDTCSKANKIMQEAEQSIGVEHE